MSEKYLVRVFIGETNQETHWPCEIIECDYSVVKLKDEQGRTFEYYGLPFCIAAGEKYGEQRKLGF